MMHAIVAADTKVGHNYCKAYDSGQNFASATTGMEMLLLGCD